MKKIIAKILLFLMFFNIFNVNISANTEEEKDILPKDIEIIENFNDSIFISKYDGSHKRLIGKNYNLAYKYFFKDSLENIEKTEFVKIGKIETKNKNREVIENIKYTVLGNENVKIDSENNILFNDKNFKNKENIKDENVFVVLADNGNNGKYIKHFEIKEDIYSFYDSKNGWGNIIRYNIFSDYDSDIRMDDNGYFFHFDSSRAMDYTPKFNPIIISNGETKNLDLGENIDITDKLSYNHIYDYPINDSNDYDNFFNTPTYDENKKVRDNDINPWNYITLKDLEKSGALSIKENIQINDNNISFDIIGDHKLYFEFKNIINTGTYQYRYNAGYGNYPGNGYKNIKNSTLNFKVLPKIEKFDYCDTSKIAKVKIHKDDNYDFSDKFFIKVDNENFDIKGNEIFVKDKNSINNNQQLKISVWNKEYRTKDYYEEIFIPGLSNPVYAFVPGSIIPEKLFHEETIDLTSCKTPANLTVKYVDSENREITDGIVEEKNVGDEYTTSAKEIEGYVLKTTPDNANGVILENGNIVTYIYDKKDVTLTVNYLDTENKKLADTITETKKFNDFYTTEEKDIEGYNLTEIPINHFGTLIEDTIVNYIYEKITPKKICKVEKDENGYLLDTNELYKGKTIDDYINNISIKEYTHIVDEEGIRYNINGGENTDKYRIVGDKLYTTIKPTKNLKLTFERKQDNVILEYFDSLIFKINKKFEFEECKANLTVKYVDTENNKLADDLVEEKNVGDNYSTSAKVIFDFILKVTPQNANGVIEELGNIVTYIYEKEKADLVVRYVDTEDIEIADTITEEKNVGDNYTTSAKQIEGYVLKITPQNANGIIKSLKPKPILSPNGDIDGFEESTGNIVTYVYEPKDSSITVNYIDTENNKLADSIHEIKKVGDFYNYSEAKIIPGYELIEISGGHYYGRITPEPIVLNFIYSKINENVTKKTIDIKKCEIKKDENGYMISDFYEVYSDIMTEANNKEANFFEKIYNGKNEFNLIDGKFYVNSLENFSSGEYKIKLKGEPLNTPLEYIFKDNYKSRLRDDPSIEIRHIDYDVFTKVDINISECPPPKANLTVKYVDTENNKLADDLVEEKNVGDNYSTSAKNIINFILKITPQNANGIIEELGNIVTYIYEKEKANLIVKFVDTENNKISDDLVEEKNIGDNYTTSPKDIENYVLKTTPDNANGIISKGDNIVTYIYEKEKANLTVKYVDTKNNKLADDLVEEKNIGDNYTTSPKDIDGYILKTTPLNNNGIITKGDNIVTYIYEKEKANLIVKFVDTENNKISDDLVEEKNVGDNYTTSPKDIENYILKTTPQNANGIIVKGDNIITYIYEKIVEKPAPIEKANLIVKYIDTENNKLADDLVEEKNVGDNYSTSPKQIDGYVLKTTPDNANGVIAKGDNIVTYIYEKIVEKPAPIEKANLIVKYIDTENNKLADDLVEERNVGSEYYTVPKIIDGYKLKVTPQNDNGIIVKGDNIVTYIYEKIVEKPAPTPIEEGEVEVKFVTIDDLTEIAEPLYIHKNIGSKYETYPKGIVNYDLISNSPNTSGTITKDKITVFYYYKRKINIIGTPPVIPEIPKDIRVIVYEPPKPEDNPTPPKVVEEQPILPNFKTKFRKIGLQTFVEEIKKGETVIKKLPSRLPKTGALDSNDLIKRAGISNIHVYENVDIRLPKKETFKLAGSKNTDLKYWLKVVPEIDRNKNQYIVLPTQGLVMPFNSVSEDSKAFQKFTSGENEDFYAYLRDGAVEIPSSPNNFGEIGNKVIAGHSSYWYDGKSRYKTHFQKIIGMEANEEIWIYKKNSKGKFERFVYKVEKSYNTYAEDTSVLNPTDNSTLTLFTCTPIGGATGRWVVKAKFIK